LDRQTRKNLKTDKFAQEVGTVWGWASGHTGDVKRYGMIAAGVLVVAIGIYLYVRHQAEARTEALAKAIQIDSGKIAPAPQQYGVLIFQSAAEKEAARQKAFNEVATKYRGTQEGAQAAFYLASDAVDKGDLPLAEKRYRDIMDSAPKAYASMARISLAQTLSAQGKYPDAEKLLKEAADNPTITVSKEEAMIQLALVKGKSDPCEARKILDPMRMDRVAVSRAVVAALGEVNANNCPPTPPPAAK
jgi:predicted negative regulator of RcsB-dependent stress response